VLFNSFSFLIFLPLVVLIYFSIPNRYRNIFLLIVSYYFYACWKAEYLILIFISTLVGYGLAILMENKHFSGPARRKLLLVISIAVNLAILFMFKYFNLFNDTLRKLFDYFNIFYNMPDFKLLLPIGISFYTFQVLSYTIDVYRKQKQPEKNLIIFGLYVSFFPQLVAGPIERSSHLIPQFKKEHFFDFSRLKDAFFLILYGYFKKVVIADRLALFVNYAYNDPYQNTGLISILATVCFAFQVYCDFSGYTDIARGSAKIIGFDLMENFNYPFISKSMTEFWRRWHISLSSWIHDYLYSPLVISKRHWGKTGIIFSLIVSFALMGLWHGASWNFLIFGLIHGLIVSVEFSTLKYRKMIQNRLKPFWFNFLSVSLTFSIWCFTLIFFRSKTIGDAFYIIRHLFDNFSLSIQIREYRHFGFAVTIILLIIFELIQFLRRRFNLKEIIYSMPIFIRWTVYYAMVFSIIIFGFFKKIAFVYFQF